MIFKKSKYSLSRLVVIGVTVPFIIANGLANAQVHQPSHECTGLSEVLSIASQQAPMVSISRARELDAQASVLQAKSLFRPQISAFGRSGFGDTDITDTSISNQFGIRLSQRVFDFGDAKYAREAARENYFASQEETLETELIVANEAGLAYLNRLKIIDQISLTKDRRQFFQEQLNQIEILLPKGGATRAEKAEVSSRLAEAKAFEVELQFLKDRAEAQLESRVGMVENYCENKADLETLNYGPGNFSEPQSATISALDNNPMIKALERKARSLESSKKRQSLSRLPVVEVVATGAYSSFNNFESFRFRDRVGVDISVPLYSGSLLKAQTQRAQARHAVAKGRVSEARRQVQENTNILFHRIRSLEVQMILLDFAAQQSALRFDAAQVEFESGRRTLSELIEVRLEYEASELEALNAEYEISIQKLNLKKLTGRLLEGNH